MRVAVVSPYYKEETSVLRRCYDSVKAQTYPDVTHFMVSDGFPHPMLDKLDVVHLKVPAHGDYGDTPRALGGWSAASHGFDAICLLDADNWIEPDHVEKMVQKQKETGAHVVTATRMLYKLNGELIGVCKESDGVNFNDTNCYLLTKPVYGALAAWVLKDKSEAIVGDRVFWNTLKKMGAQMAHVMTPTVNYVTNFAFHYQVNGLVPPDDSKIIVRFQNEEHSKMMSWKDYKAATSQP